MANKICSYSQWHASDVNNPADELSRNFTLTDDELTNLILSKFKDRVSSTLHISLMPVEIASMVFFWLHTKRLTPPFIPELTPAQTGLGLPQ